MLESQLIKSLTKNRNDMTCKDKFAVGLPGKRSMPHVQMREPPKECTAVVFLKKSVTISYQPLNCSSLSK